MHKKIRLILANILAYRHLAKLGFTVTKGYYTESCRNSCLQSVDTGLFMEQGNRTFPEINSQIMRSGPFLKLLFSNIGKGKF